MKSLLALLMLAALFAPGRLSATVFEASWSNSVLLRDDQIDTARPMVGINEGLLFSARKIKGTSASFYSDLVYSRDYAQPGQARFQVTSAYLDWERVCRHASLRLGRQRNVESNEPVYIDGIQIQSRLMDRFVLTGIGGRLVPSRYDKDQFVTRQDTSDLDVTLRADALLGRSRTGLIFQNRSRDFNATMRDLGAFYARDFSDRLYGRANLLFDLIDNQLRQGQAEVEWRISDRLLLDAQGALEDHKIDSSSVFETKVFRDYEEGSLNAVYNLSESMILSGGYLLRRFNGDEMVHELLARFSRGPIRAGLRQDFGFGGAVTRFDAGMKIFERALFGADLSAGLTRYPETGAADSTSNAFFGAVALEAGPKMGLWNVRLEGQGLRNRFYDYDARAYLSTVVHFARGAR